MLVTLSKIIKCSSEWTQACTGLELSNLQSDQDSFRLLTMIRTTTKVSAHTVMSTATTIVVVLRDGGLTKFGSCPSGGTPAGIAQRSTPGGISEEAIVIRSHGEIKAHRDVRSFARPDPTSYENSRLWKCLELSERTCLTVGTNGFRSAAASQPPLRISSCISGQAQQQQRGSDRLELTEMDFWGPLGNLTQSRKAQVMHVTNQSPSISVHLLWGIHIFSLKKIPK